MDIVSRNRMMVFTGGANMPLAEEVAEVLGIQLGSLTRSTFSSGEIYVRPDESVRGADCFVMQSHSNPVNDNIMQQLITIDALKRASARSITAVMPYFGYSRQDKKVMPREPISARLVSDLLMKAGADRLAVLSEGEEASIHSKESRGVTRGFGTSIESRAGAGDLT